MRASNFKPVSSLTTAIPTGMAVAVARMECNGIREERSAAFPDYTAFHPGCAFCARFTSTRQQGVVLIITLIVLIAMTLATIALVRSVDTGNVIVGNLAFKQGATHVGDLGTEAAVSSWLDTNAGTPASLNDIPAIGYYATGMLLDMTGTSTNASRYAVDWDGNSCSGAGVASSHCLTPSPTITTDPNTGDTVQYIINRLCLNPGQGPTQGNCPTIASNIQGTSQGDQKYNPPPPTATMVEFYRITSRVKGQRNTVSYVESIVHY